MKFNQQTGRASEIEKKPGDQNQKTPDKGHNINIGEKKPAQGGYHEGEKSK